MRMYDLIHKKRMGMALTKAELEGVINGYVAGDIPDYQMSALTMAVCFQGMDANETTDLTLAMAQSGEILSLADIEGMKVDKHSTGGVGDTTTLVLAPWVAAVGVPVAKMSGRGLGHTGGTIDKLEAIPGFKTQMSMHAFKQQVRDIGVAIAAQTGDLAPADKKLYALRDVTDTVQSIPLIASSIMSKKIASGADAIVLDVKVGSGAFMKDLQHARELAEAMVAIGELANRQTVALITRMEEPLGRAVGNVLEVREAISTLRGQGPADLVELCLALGAQMVVQSGMEETVEAARTRMQEALDSGAALAKMRELITAQGGDARVLDDLSLLPSAPVKQYLAAPLTGVVTGIDAEAVGLVVMHLGAGRQKREDDIDLRVGVNLLRKVGDSVMAGEPLVEVHARTEAEAEVAMNELARSIQIRPNASVLPEDIVIETVRAHSTPSVTKSEALKPMSADRLIEAAKVARGRAYVPYSHFAVGAAVELTNGEVIGGANVENASYGLTNCAERTAIFKTVTADAYQQGARIKQIAVIADSLEPVAPCGACRQVMREFCSEDTVVWLADLRGNVIETRVGALLPRAFGPEQMPNGD